MTRLREKKERALVVLVARRDWAQHYVSLKQQELTQLDESGLPELDSESAAFAPIIAMDLTARREYIQEQLFYWEGQCATFDLMIGQGMVEVYGGYGLDTYNRPHGRKRRASTC